MLTNLSWASEVNEQNLLNNLAYGQLVELNQYSPGQQKGLMLRLFATPAGDESCGLETSGTCKNKHLITVATLNELPEVQVHALRTKGEFVKAEWVLPKSGEVGPDQAELILTFRQYHRFATRFNHKLPKKFDRVSVKITLQGIEETLLTK